MEQATREIIKQRIQSYTVEDENGCWIWQRATSKNYGVLWNPETKKIVAAHILAYLAWIGDYPSGLTLDHEVCDNSMCCNPQHLVPKTGWDNTRRSKTNPFAVKARADVCVNGHEFDGINTYIHPKRGTRHCKQCKRDRDNAAYLARVGSVRRTRRRYE